MFVLVILIILDWLLLVISVSSDILIFFFTSHSDLDNQTDPNIDEEMMKAYKDLLQDFEEHLLL